MPVMQPYFAGGIQASIVQIQLLRESSSFWILPCWFLFTIGQPIEQAMFMKTQSESALQVAGWAITSFICAAESSQ